MEDKDGYDEQAQAVQERSHEAHTLVAEGRFSVGRSPAYPDRHEPQGYRQSVCNHVAGVAQEREAVAQEPADHLSCHYEKGYKQGYRKPFFTRKTHGIV
jgi:hypothetical protein